MTVVSLSQTSTSTFKSDVTALNYAKQPNGAADSATLATSAKRFRKFLQRLSPSRLGQCCARSQPLPAAERYPVLLGVMLIAMTLALVTGCGSAGSAVSVAPPVAIAGVVQGGHGPVSGASVQLYAASSGGLGSASTPLLQNAVTSDSNGNFSIPAGYSCPSPSSPVYVVATGGSVASSSGQNSALVLTAMLGPCSGLAALGSVSVNEVTTVGSVWPLAHYFTSPTNLGSASSDTTFASAVSSVPEFINLAKGTSPGTPTSTSSFAENNKLYSLADVFAACVSSSGGKAGDGSPCGQLFSMATSAGGSAPTDTMTAAVQIAQNPDNNVAGIYGLVKGSTAFEPTLTDAPSDWTLTLSYTVATPSISLATGTYSGTQDVTISDATQGSTIYYTTNGTVPTSSSNVYTGPISIAVSSTVEAIAVLAGSSSGVASSTLTITSALPPAKLAFVQQPSNALTGATISPAVTVAVRDSNGSTVTSATNPVTLALTSGSGLTGTLTATPTNGVATFSNLSIGTAGSYTLSATSPSLASATSAGFSITAGSSAPLPSAKLAFVQQPSNALTGATISPAVTVAVQDSNGNTLTSATNPVTLALTSGSGLTGTLTATPTNGVATFSNLSIGNAGSYTLSATSPSLASATSAGFSITAGSSSPLPTTPLPPAKLAFVQQPTSASTGATISPAVTVAVEDSNGNPVTSATNQCTLALVGGTGLAGTLTATPQNGVATFSNLTVGTAGTYALSASSPSLTSATSTSFTIGTAATVNTPAGTVATPVITASGGTVTITDSTPGVGIWYTTDGSTPTLPPGGVPQGTSTSYTPMCKPITQPPLANLKNIVDYGAVAGGQDNTTAIVNACNAAGPANGSNGIYIPAGVWYAGNFVYGSTPLNCSIYGQGFTSEIYCPNPITNGNNCQMYSTGSNEVWSNFSHQMPFTTRDASNFNMSHNAGSNNRIDTVMVVGGNAGGIQNNGDSNAINTNNGVFNTGADCNYHVATTGDVTDHTYVYNCGDDGISNVSYSGQPTVTNILDQWNAIWNEPSARGILVSSSNTTVQDNLIDNTSVASGIAAYVQDFSGTVTQAISNDVIQYNSIVNSSGSEYNASIFTLASTQSATNLLVLGNIISDSSNRGGISTQASGGAVSDVTYQNNSIGTTGSAFSSVGTPTNIQCTGNTQNGTPNNSGGSCGGTNPDAATGASVTYSGCVVGTATQYTGPITINSSTTVKAIAVRPGLTNSSVASGTY